MSTVARTYRLPEGLVARLEAEAGRLGQSYTVFVVRALEQALGSGQEISAGGMSGQPSASVKPGPASRVSAPASVRASSSGVRGPVPSHSDMAPASERRPGETAVQYRMRLKEQRLGIAEAAASAAMSRYGQ